MLNDPATTVDDDEGIGFGVLVTPRLGTVIDGPTTTASLAFEGFYDLPESRIEIQVRDAGVWQTIATTTSAGAESVAAPRLYEFRVTASPAALVPASWPQGGLLHVRAIGPDGSQLAGLFHDVDACLNQTADWRTRASLCGGVFASGTIVVSPASIAGAADHPRYLDRRGTVDALETRTYYETIGAPPTVDEFRSRYGIEDALARAVYYNAGDLGVGRDMRCVPQPDGVLACTVENYGTFGGSRSDALDQAIDHESPFATVAMIYTPPVTAPNSVQFIVYDAGGELTDRAQLDAFGDNQAIPNNCLNCHGTTASYDAVSHAVTGARFLPFDRDSFVFSARGGFASDDQQPAVTLLNELVRDAAATPATRELIAGWAVESASPFVPPGWTQTALDRAVYQHVVGSTCRGCHASNTDELAFATADDFRRNRAAITSSVCDERDMPNAQVSLDALWTGPARAYLAAYFDLDACDATEE